MRAVLPVSVALGVGDNSIVSVHTLSVVLASCARCGVLVLLCTCMQSCEVCLYGTQDACF